MYCFYKICEVDFFIKKIDFIFCLDLKYYMYMIKTGNESKIIGLF